MKIVQVYDIRIVFFYFSQKIECTEIRKCAVITRQIWKLQMNIAWQNRTNVNTISNPLFHVWTAFWKSYQHFHSITFATFLQTQHDITSATEIRCIYGQYFQFSTSFRSSPFNPYIIQIRTLTLDAKSSAANIINNIIHSASTI